MYPALLRYMSILFLNILTLLALTQSADNLFHSFTVLCENENFLISNLHCFFANVHPCPLVLLSSLTEEERSTSKTNCYCRHIVMSRFNTINSKYNVHMTWLVQALLLQKHGPSAHFSMVAEEKPHDDNN